MTDRIPGSIGILTQPILDAGTTCRIECPLPGPLCGDRTAPQRDEVAEIAAYMADEINRNAHGQTVRHMAEMNAFSASDCIADYTRLPLWRQLLGLGLTPQQCTDMEMNYHLAALTVWAGQVRQDGPWDHKPIIAARFNPRRPGGRQYWHAHQATEYYYDVWSNLHYGYVGAAAGFSDAALLDGAGAEQVVSSVLRGRAPRRTPGVSGLRAWDDRSDREAIDMGIRLRRRRPDRVTAYTLVRMVVGSASVDRRPVQP